MDPELRAAVDEINEGLKGLDDRFGAQTKEIGDLAAQTKEINDRFTSHSKDVDEKFSTFQESVRNDLKIYFENMEDLVTSLAEAYGGTLDSIKQQLDGFKTHCDTRFQDHNAVLDDHKKRIAVLEQDRVS